MPAQLSILNRHCEVRSNQCSPLLPTAYWPPVQYYTKIVGQQAIYLEQHEHYQKQTYRNRCVIYAANGPTALVIPIIRMQGRKMPIRDVRIDYSTPWQRVHWKAIVSAYRSSAFFEYYEDDFRSFYEREETFLFDLNEKILHLTLELTGLHTKVGYTAEFIPSDGDMPDWRTLISPKVDFTADTKFKPQSYYQVFAPKHGFAANLSILDLLCNEGNNSLSVLQASKI
ncbi:MAG: WbqC family protein [Bacteroidales bacterium]|nr:WbqC family protein [Bacteroidales bacterium]MCL2133375.1 WbqC family protein [Bacteroidales bacterium]